MFSLKNGFKRKEFYDIDPRKEIDQWESSLRNVFYVLSVKKNLFSVSLMRVVKVIYINTCVKRIFGFISEFDD